MVGGVEDQVGQLAWHTDLLGEILDLAQFQQLWTRALRWILAPCCCLEEHQLVWPIHCVTWELEPGLDVPQENAHDLGLC